MPRPPTPLSAILHVNPSPTSLAYTSAIYNKLKASGNILSFQALPKIQSSTTPQKNEVPEHQAFRVTFSSRSDLDHALSTPTFTVDVDHNLPRPEGLDPFRIFGLTSRKRFEPVSFDCTIQQEDPDAPEPTPKKAKLVKDERTGFLYNSLFDAKAPLGQLEGLATIVEPVTEEEETKVSAGSPPLRLMSMYREAMRKQAQPELSEEQEEQKPKISYFPVGRLRRWMR
jgi:hypothetical protein